MRLCRPDRPTKVLAGEMPLDVVRGLYRKHIVYLEVPVKPTDSVSGAVFVLVYFFLLLFFSLSRSAVFPHACWRAQCPRWRTL